jgi:hypothetical protein
MTQTKLPGFNRQAPLIAEWDSGRIVDSKSRGTKAQQSQSQDTDKLWQNGLQMKRGVQLRREPKKNKK